MRILDMSAGHRNIWLNRLHPETIFVDIRPEVIPTVIADTTELPFRDGFFNLVVFDPPHVTHGERSTMAKYYGAFPAEVIRDLVKRSGAEAFRCTRTDGLMAFKWNDHDVKLQRVLDLMEGWEPLFAQKVASRSKHRSGSYWVMLRKKAGGYQNESQMRLVLNEPG